jgi:hypothetical protein
MGSVSPEICLQLQRVSLCAEEHGFAVIVIVTTIMVGCAQAVGMDSVSGACAIDADNLCFPMVSFGNTQISLLQLPGR